ncbi:MAG: peptide chain release factor N(5)-glutamine methyltransferase [Candidatus Magasanikbacteria bacterium]|jgi:release factor glutamine methyltransferase
MITLKTLLQQSKIDALDAEIICAEVCKKPRAYILTHPEFFVTKAQERKILALFDRRQAGEPLAYLTGRKEFYGLDFFVDKRVLVPRPETELMAETAIDIILNFEFRISNKFRNINIKNNTVLIDIGTGSGCVPIAIAKKVIASHSTVAQSRLSTRGVYPEHSRTGSAQNDTTVMATDISADALAVAKKNAHRHGVKIKFLQGDLLSPVIKFLIPKTFHLKPTTSHLIITANLPYGWKAWKNNCSMATRGLKFEPASALYTGKKGLELYEKLFKQIKSLLLLNPYLPTGQAGSLILLIEFDPRQTVMLKTLVKKHLPTASVLIKKDLAGHDRVAVISITYSPPA